MKRTNALCLIVCIAAALFDGCNRQPSPQGAAGKRLRLAFVTNNASDFWTIARRGTEKAAQELPNVEVDFRIPGEGTAAEQKRLVDDLLARGVDGMAISPVDPANQTQMLNDAAKQILVLTQDSDAPQSDRACYIGTDNRAAGRQAGELIKQALPGGGKIMVFVGKADAQNAKERFEGIKEVLTGSNVQIIDLRTDDADRVRAKANAADTLVKYPEVAAMVGLWAYNGPAILSAVRDAGKTGQVKIIAFDEEDDTLKGVKDGSIVGTIVQQPYEFGYQSIKAMAQILGGDRSLIPSGKQIFVPTKVIRSDSVDAFSQQLNQLRGRS
ncbi:MAG: ABC transporter substrate-binding protein [Acidobacteria bacterium]|nr:MAG: ABC transporter substrate-binding protein [Acidobacteriota bacterium]